MALEKFQITQFLNRCISVNIHFHFSFKLMKKTNKLSYFSAAVIALLSTSAPAQQAAPAFQGTIGKTLAESKEYRPAAVKAKPGAPNVLWILLDDVGFGAASSFGGIISTP